MSIFVPIYIAILCFIIMVFGEILSYYSISLKYKYEFESMSFGFILGIATLILIPKSSSSLFSVYVILGLLTVYILEKYLSYCPLSKKYCTDCNTIDKNIKIKIIYPISFFIHTFIDGLIIAISYIGNIGIPLYTAIIIHKIPAGFVLIPPLKDNYKNPLIIGSLISFGTLLGTIFGLFLLSRFPSKVLLGYSGGVFLGAFLMLVPHIYEHKKEKTFLYVLLGYMFAGIIALY